VSPASAVVAVGSTKQFQAIATYSDASSAVVSAGSWTSASSVVATVNSNGLATGVAASASSVGITATLGGQQATAALTVNASASLVCTGGAGCVPLGLADTFTILAQTMITDATVSSITGNIGVSAAAGSTITVPCASMLTGKVYDVDGTYTGGAGCSMPGPGANKTTVDTAVANMGTAYTDAATRVSPAPVNNLGAGDISGMTLTPGMYKWTTPLLIYAGNPNGIASGDITGVTLNCTAGGSTSVFIFQVSGALTEGLPATPAHINLTGGCLASNIFWQTTNDVTITPGSVFNGNILTATQVVMQAGAVLHGRALAQTAVTLIQNTVGP
jgi:hypothetical protein